MLEPTCPGALAVISAVVLILVTETGILALLSGSLTGVLTAINDLGTIRGGCGNEALMALDMTNLSLGQSKKTVRAGFLHGYRKIAKLSIGLSFGIFQLFSIPSINRQL